MKKKKSLMFKELLINEKGPESLEMLSLGILIKNQNELTLMEVLKEDDSYLIRSFKDISKYSQDLKDISKINEEELENILLEMIDRKKVEIIKTKKIKGITKHIHSEFKILEEIDFSVEKINGLNYFSNIKDFFKGYGFVKVLAY